MSEIQMNLSVSADQSAMAETIDYVRQQIVSAFAVQAELLGGGPRICISCGATPNSAGTLPCDH
ncbi:hypothetical protein [Pandoraea faecigallinarum]|uniref:Uncharacterized protein n=1 Tax=Pandoraea faecigallinarum TaxID=656179 RepID=A0A173GZY7_9BURK|nr:hypothetical protein [Pandoraea faecigallinarum]